MAEREAGCVLQEAEKYLVLWKSDRAGAVCVGGCVGSRRAFPSAGVTGFDPPPPSPSAAPSPFAAFAASISAAEGSGSCPAGTDGGRLPPSPPPDCSTRAASTSAASARARIVQASASFASHLGVSC